ncbi:class I SAM-dependent methyltransferase [Chloroflexota bacterium]
MIETMIIFNYETLVDPLLRDIRKLTPDFAGMNVGDLVLDVCCGTGEQVFEYGRRGIIAIGIDNSRDMLKIALKNRLRQKSGNVQFKLADAANLPFPDGYYDYASISFGLHDKNNLIRGQVISEMKRVVKLEGALIFIDFQVPMPMNVWAAFARTIEFLAGGSHYRGFKDYLRNGGLEGIIMNHHLREHSRAYLKSRLIVMMKVAND